jgi:hypothetical protein
MNGLAVISVGLEADRPVERMDAAPAGGDRAREGRPIETDGGQRLQASLAQGQVERGASSLVAASRIRSLVEDIHAVSASRQIDCEQRTDEAPADNRQALRLLVARHESLVLRIIAAASSTCRARRRCAPHRTKVGSISGVEHVAGCSTL